MIRIGIIGSGIIGGIIAYELSKIEGIHITLIDEKMPASGSTGAALGVLMGAISHKTKGKAWQMRENSIRRYQKLIPELEEMTGIPIPVNHDGILQLLFPENDLEKLEKLIAIRANQGWNLEFLSSDILKDKCPHVENSDVVGGIYSPEDCQINPTILTEALVKAASINGVECKFGLKVENLLSMPVPGSEIRRCYSLETGDGIIEVDWAIVSAGLGSTHLTKSLGKPLDIRPVLGQALRLKLDKPMGHKEFQPVITGNDVHIVPLLNSESGIGNSELLPKFTKSSPSPETPNTSDTTETPSAEYWIGATVEFPNDAGEVVADAVLLDKVKQEAMEFCPALANGKIIHSWLGKRPRPEGQPAPIIRKLPDYENVLLATGHYRNGILLAPVTAQIISDIIFDYN